MEMFDILKMKNSSFSPPLALWQNLHCLSPALGHRPSASVLVSVPVNLYLKFYQIKA